MQKTKRMKRSCCLLLCALLSSSLIRAQSVYSELSLMESDYVSSKVCEKLKSKKGKEFAYELIGKIFTDDNKEKTTEELLELFRDESSIELLPLHKLDVIKLARCHRQIDDVIFSLFRKQIQFEIQRAREETVFSEPVTRLKMQEYVVKKSSIQNKVRGLDKTTKNPFPLKKFPMEVYGIKGLTMRERLYTYYSERQMRSMAKVIDRILNIIDAEKVETKINLRDGSDPIIIEHTPSDIYRLALRMFTMERKRIVSEPGNGHLPFLPIDFVASAHELKVIDSDVVHLLTEDESFFKPEKSMAKKLASYFGKLGLTAAQLNPASAPYALLGIIIYNTYTEVNKIKNSVEAENFYFGED